MNSLARKLCEQIDNEIVIINKLLAISFDFKEIAIKRDLSALEKNNIKKRASLLMMVSLQRAKDALIYDLAVSLGLHKNASVNEILVSGKLDSESQQQQLSNRSKELEAKIKELDTTNSLVSLILITSFKHNKSAIDLFRVHGTIDSTYCNKVQIKAARQRSKINQKI